MASIGLKCKKGCGKRVRGRRGDMGSKGLKKGAEVAQEVEQVDW